MILLGFSNILLIVTLLVKSLEVNGATVHYELVITRRFVSPDGFQKSALVVNGNLIGPTIEAFVGDTVIVNVTNHAADQEGISLHWHGVTDLSNVFYDGAQSVTNCPIPSGSSYQQSFTALREGTHFYHAHSGSMRVEGTYGVIAFRNPSPKHHFDGEFSLILSDWYHESVLHLATGLANNPFKWVNNGNSILMNGKGLSRECSNDTVPTTTTTTVTYSNGEFNSTSVSCQGQRERFAVESGKTYLLRLVNAAALGYFNFAIAGHKMVIIGTGTSATKPRAVNSVELSAGQRLDVLVTCDQYTIDPTSPNDSMTFLMSVQSDYRGSDNSHAGVAKGYMSYFSPSAEESDIIFNKFSTASPIHDSRNWETWNSLLKQEVNHSTFLEPPETVSASYYFVTQQEWVASSTGMGFNPAMTTPQDNDDSISLAWTLNGSRLIFPNTPYLLQSVITKKKVDGSAIIRVNVNEVIDITIQNSVAGNGVCENHPWHIHGYGVWVVGEGAGAFDPVTDPLHYNLIDPPFLDTVTNYPSVHGTQRDKVFENGTWKTPCGWFTMRLKATQPGMWFFHCHVEWHAAMGMGLVFDVESETVDSYPEDMPLCGDAIQNDIYRQVIEDNDSNYVLTPVELAIISLGSAIASLGIAALGYYLLFYYGKGSRDVTKLQDTEMVDSPFRDKYLQE